jgi:hypothetical protein
VFDITFTKIRLSPIVALNHNTLNAQFRASLRVASSYLNDGAFSVANRCRYNCHRGQSLQSSSRVPLRLLLTSLHGSLRRSLA